MPPSWVSRLSLTPAEFEARCPGRNKDVKFHRGVLEVWAPYAREDGLVRRVTVYKDRKRTEAVEVHESFEHRKDKLLSRTRKVRANTVVETFLPGRSDGGLREYELVSGVSRKMDFYPNARLDGLQLRHEMLGIKTVEHYQGRDDRLVYRSVTFDPAAHAGTGGGDAKAADADHAVVKMAEKYSRNEAVDADEDVAKRVYHVGGDIVVLYHHGKGRITNSKRVFHRDGRPWPPQVTVVDPFAKPPPDSVLRENYQALINAERECMQAFREQERQMKEILSKRAEEEESFQLEVSVYDTSRQRHFLDAEGKEDAAAAAVMHDYLTPFLDDPKSSEPLPRDKALKVRDLCLKSLRERLVERATIIQSRLDEENNNLHKKTSTFSRNRDHADKETEEEYERYCQGAMFRIQIIDERLKRHEKQALQKYDEMDNRLRNDPRMRNIYQ
mmetsp:Transcript_24783/g.72853  ORF Transcript_24783/g.72853 Transcript_24783/m.72853 type:complete len:443 (+) Transcript_24783:251-1579(+)